MIFSLPFSTEKFLGSEMNNPTEIHGKRCSTEYFPANFNNFSLKALN